MKEREREKKENMRRTRVWKRRQQAQQKVD